MTDTERITDLADDLDGLLLESLCAVEGETLPPEQLQAVVLTLMHFRDTLQSHVDGLVSKVRKEPHRGGY